MLCKVLTFLFLFIATRKQVLQAHATKTKLSLSLPAARPPLPSFLSFSHSFFLCQFPLQSRCSQPLFSSPSPHPHLPHPSALSSLVNGSGRLMKLSRTWPRPDLTAVKRSSALSRHLGAQLFAVLCVRVRVCVCVRGRARLIEL